MTTPSFDPVVYLLAQLNLINPTALLALSPSNVTITNPIATDESAATDAIAPAINTAATLTAVDGQGFAGTSQFYYQRLTLTAYLAALGHSGSLTLPPTGISDWPSFFSAFNTTYGTVFTAVDYPATPFSAPSDGLLTVAMPATSLLFVGSMTITLGGSATVNLANVVTYTALTGLVAPATLATLVPNRVITAGLTLPQLVQGSPAPTPN